MEKYCSVPKAMEDEIWKRFSSPIDEFFKKKVKVDEKEQDEERIKRQKKSSAVGERICHSTEW